jgi:hypothetical protein
MAVTKCADLVPKAVCRTPASSVALSRRTEDIVQHFNELLIYPYVADQTRSVFPTAPPCPLTFGRIGCGFSSMRSCIPETVPEQSDFHDPSRVGLHECCMRHAKDG